MPLKNAIEMEKKKKKRRKSIHKEFQFFCMYNIIYCRNISSYATIELILYSRITSNESNVGKGKDHTSWTVGIRKERGRFTMKSALQPSWDKLYN